MSRGDRPTCFESQQRTRTSWHVSVLLISSGIFCKAVISFLDVIFSRSALVAEEYKLWRSTLHSFLYHSVTQHLTKIILQDRQCVLDVTMRRLRVAVVAVEKQRVAYYECVFVVLAAQHVKCMRYIISSSATSPTLQHLSTLSLKRHDFWKKSY